MSRLSEVMYVQGVAHNLVPFPPYINLLVFSMVSWDFSVQYWRTTVIQLFFLMSTKTCFSAIKGTNFDLYGQHMPTLLSLCVLGFSFVCFYLEIKWICSRSTDVFFNLKITGALDPLSQVLISRSFFIHSLLCQCFLNRNWAQCSSWDWSVWSSLGH